MWHCGFIPQKKNLPSGVLAVGTATTETDDGCVANEPANGPALIFGGSKRVSNTLADVIGLRYELRGTVHSIKCYNKQPNCSRKKMYFTHSLAVVPTIRGPNYSHRAARSTATATSVPLSLSQRCSACSTHCWRRPAQRAQTEPDRPSRIRHTRHRFRRNCFPRPRRYLRPSWCRRHDCGALATRADPCVSWPAAESHCR